MSDWYSSSSFGDGPSWTERAARGETGRGAQRTPRAFRGGRASWRTSGRGGRAITRPDPVASLPMGALRGTISFAEIESVSRLNNDSVQIEEGEHVASYNWLNTETPTILVPGEQKAAELLMMDAD